MAEIRQIQKALAGAEDILLGQGTVVQLRNGVSLVISKINAENIPFTGDVETGNFVSIKESLDHTVTQTETDGAMVVPVGNTLQRPIAAYSGYTRYNTELDQLEVYSEDTASWYSIGTNVNAATATKFETARLINGIPFNGTVDIDLGTYTEDEVDAGFVSQTAEDGAAELPVGTSVQRPVTPTLGMIRYNSEEAIFEGYNGTDWYNLTGATLDSPEFAGTPTAPTAIAGTNTTQLSTTAFVLANRFLNNASKSTNGYKIIDDGTANPLIIQWGRVTTTVAPGTVLTINFNTAFPTDIGFSGVQVVGTSGVNLGIVAPTAVANSLSSMTMTNFDTDTNIEQLRWIAIGY